MRLIDRERVPPKIGRRVPRYDLQQRDATLNRTIANRVKVTIGNNTFNEPRDQGGNITDSVSVTIGMNYRGGSANVATTGTGSKRDMDSAIVAIQPA
jgi:hypothetical protein